MGIAGEAIRDKRYAEATEFLNKAIDLAKNSSDRLKCYEALFQIAQVQRNSGAAISYGNKILAENPRNGRVLLYLAELSAGNASRYYPMTRSSSAATTISSSISSAMLPA